MGREEIIIIFMCVVVVSSRIACFVLAFQPRVKGVKGPCMMFFFFSCWWVYDKSGLLRALARCNLACVPKYLF